MSTLHTDTSQFINQIQKPSDGDERDAQSFNVGFEGLADRTRYLKDQGFYSALSFGGTGIVPYTNTGFYHVNGGILLRSGSNIGFWNGFANTVRNYIRCCDIGASSTNPLIPEWGQEAGRRWKQVTPGSSRVYVNFSCDVPDASTLTAFTIAIQPVVSANHAADLTGLDRPVCELVRVDANTGVEDIVGTVTEPATTKAAYETLHLLLGFTNPALSVVDKATYSYHIRFVGETSDVGNAAGLLVYAPKFGYSRAKLGED